MMRRSTQLFIFAAAFGLALTSVTPAAIAKKKKITWWVPSEYSWLQMKKLFEKENPDITVQIINGDLDKFYTMITAGLMPDVWGSVSTPGISADVNRNWALDLTPYIKRDGAAMKISEMFPGVMSQFKVEGGCSYSMLVFPKL
jgi:ABC-type glycerol-3-phosphate transport system substrate-binding protein